MHYPRHQGSYLMKKGTWFPSLYSSPSIPCFQRPLSFLVFCFLCQECYTFFLSWANSHKTSKDSMQTRFTSTRRLCCLSPAPSSLFIWSQFIVQLHHSSPVLVKGWRDVFPPQVYEPRCGSASTSRKGWFFFFKKLFLAALGLQAACGLSLVSASGGYSLVGVRAFYYGGFSCCRTQALELSSCGPQA